MLLVIERLERINESIYLKASTYGVITQSPEPMVRVKNVRLLKI